MQTKKFEKIINNEIIPVIIYNELPNNYKIQKQNNNKKIISKEFKKNNKQIKEKFYLYINKYISILNKNLIHCNLENTTNNIKNIKIEEKYSKRKSFLLNASYYTKDNKIILYNKNHYKKSLSHELLHMSSTKKINDKLYLCGFAIVDFKAKKKYGTFINEGYTEYLNGKYFNNAEVYETQMEFAKQLEKIIGVKLMEEMYFNADLKGLISELMTYKNTKNEVLEFILNTDIIHRFEYPILPLNKLKVKKAALQINAFLIKTYYVKLLKEELSYEEILKQMIIYINELSNINIGYKSNEYYIKETKEYYKKTQKKKLKQ